jgi:ABC-type Fe3+ transport system permease subunit
MVGVGRFIGPGPGGSAFQLAAVLLLVACGIGVAVAGVRFGVRAVRAGRDMATAPLVIGAFLAVWGLVVLVGTVGRFLGWH